MKKALVVVSFVVGLALIWMQAPSVAVGVLLVAVALVFKED
jgi:hypothetical protein